ncbi:MAG: hypothetical protein AAB225_15370 [Acidobacteriota bacterium]
MPGILAGGLVALLCGCIEACSNTDIRRLEESMGLRAAFARKAWFGFAPYPRARELCRDQRDYGIGGEETWWSSYASTDATQKAIASYQAREPRNVEMSDGSVTVRHEDRKVLSIHAVAPADYPACGNTPRPGEQTVLVVSQLFRRR